MPNPPREPDGPKPLDQDALDELNSTRHFVGEAKRDLKSSAWTHLSGKIRVFMHNRFGRVNLPPGTELDDFTSEVMLRVLRDLDKFEDRGEGSFWGWLHRLAQNRLNDLWRYEETRRSLRGAEPEPTDEGVDPLDQIGDPDALSATAILRHRELERAELDCVNALPENWREVYVMRRSHEMSFGAIAPLVGGANENTLRSMYKRARDAVQACIHRKLDALGPSIKGWK